jgi:DNA-binding IclR family transcriptional regulator
MLFAQKYYLPRPVAKVDAQILWRAIAEIRRTGYAETHNKRIAEGASISAAVRGPADEVLGAMTVSIPINRYTDDVRSRTIEVITGAARALSRQLGAS